VVGVRHEFCRQVEDARIRIALLVAWRRGAGAGAVLSAGFLATGLLGSVGPLIAFGTAICVMGGVEIVLRCALRQDVLCPEFAEIEAVARYRDRLCSARNRRRLATWLRSTARPSPAVRGSPYVLWDRVALGREELLALADELESAHTIDPRTMIEIKELLSNGRDSPLLNEHLPAAAVISTVRCARFRVITAPLQDSLGRSALTPIRPGPAPNSGPRASHTPDSGHSAG
jgi:hypothetical protein